MASVSFNRGLTRELSPSKSPILVGITSVLKKAQTEQEIRLHSSPAPYHVDIFYEEQN